MKYASTRNPSKTVPFREAVFQGLAPDGGLYVPTTEPDLRGLIRSFGKSSSFQEIASALTEKLFEDDLSPASARRVADNAFSSFSPRITELTDRIAVLELFHGPSCAFKDFGASFLASIMEELLQTERKQAIILTATSGDTGSAVARAFFGKAGIDVVILYPSGRVSPLQEKQLTTLGGNVRALEVKGSFDDCQRMVKEAFVDPELSKKLNLTSANSINLGRLIPQAFYYVYGAARSGGAENPVTFTVPSGNFGNLTAGVYAWKWGMPVGRFIAATNLNDVVPEYLKTGIFSPRASVHTLSNAMDVGNPSNFERLKWIFRNDPAEMTGIIRGETVTDEETGETISRVLRDYGMFVDPHTAVGILASERNLSNGGTERILTLSTAHPGKFLEVVEETTGKKPPIPERLEKLLALPKNAVLIGNTSKDLAGFLIDTFR